METHFAERIVLIGPTGSGKTATARAVADQLGWRLLDTDDLIVAAAGRDIAAIFAEDGEARFRDLEAAALAHALEQHRVVIATGAGIVERLQNVMRMRSLAWVVALTCRPEEALRRIRAQAADQPLEAVRPKLAGPDPLAIVRQLHERRAVGYVTHDDEIRTDELSPEAAAARIVVTLVMRDKLGADAVEERTTTIPTSTGETYDVVVSWGGLSTLPARFAERDLPARAFLVTDATVHSLYGSALKQRIVGERLVIWGHRVPAGEASKSRDQLDAIHDWLIERQAERGEAVIAFGGGVVGDLAGFAAATYLRGVPLVQVPTSLLAQVDASIGGKVAINHPHGKNLIGAFYPPRLVLTDPALLLTLPPRQFTEGWAEVVKHGIALDAAYLEQVEGTADTLLAKEPAALVNVIAGSVALKGSIVAGDEREREGGRRHLLNYGHTIGHAIETVAGYGTWLHGEAVAAGMAAEARLGVRLGITPPAVVARQDALLARFGLPTRAGGLSVSALLRACLWDKKVRGGRVRWVLPTGPGTARLVDGVPDADVRAALLEIGAVADEPPPLAAEQPA